MNKKNRFVSIVMVLALVAGWAIWKFVLGAEGNFKAPINWEHPNPINVPGQMYTGGFIVPILIGISVMIVTFVVERFLSLNKAQGKRDLQQFLVSVEKQLNDGNIDAVIDMCNQQKGTVANIIRAGIDRFKEVRNDAALNNEQKAAEIKRALEEATMIETPLLERNLVVLSTIASVSTMVGLLGTVMGMIRSFSALGASGSASSATELSVGISEALYNTALGIGGAIFAIIFFNLFTNKVDRFVYMIDEASLNLVEVLNNRFIDTKKG